MYENQDKKLSDTIIGEAILELLDERTSITNAILLLKLQTFLITADETWRETAIRAAIRSIQAADLDGGSKTGVQPPPLH